MDAGNRIVLDKDVNGKCISYLERKATGKRTAIHERNGAFQLNITIPKGKDEEVDAVQVKVEEQGFPRQGTLEADLFY